MPTTSTTSKLTFEEYLTYNDGTNNRYELVDGELILMTPPTVRHALIIRFLTNALEAEISRLNLSWVPLQGIGMRTSIKRSRLPDLCIVTMEQIQDYLDESAVIESPALLAVEIVSLDSVARDYRFKRSEYGAIGIPEYWIVDPIEQKVTVLLLVEGFYEEAEYREEEKIISQTFPEIELTVAEVLKV